MAGDRILHAQLQMCYVQIEDQIQTIRRLSEEQDASMFEMRHSDGSFMLTPLLVAKAQVLGGMAALKAKP